LKCGDWLEHVGNVCWVQYVQQQEASVNRLVHWSHVRVDADRRQDVRLRSKLAVVVREWTVAIHNVWHWHSRVDLWQTLIADTSCAATCRPNSQRTWRRRRKWKKHNYLRDLRDLSSHAHLAVEVELHAQVTRSIRGFDCILADNNTSVRWRYGWTVVTPTSLISEMTQNMAIVTMGRQQELVCELSNGATSNDITSWKYQDIRSSTWSASGVCRSAQITSRWWASDTDWQTHLGCSQAPAPVFYFYFLLCFLMLTLLTILTWINIKRHEASRGLCATADPSRNISFTFALTNDKLWRKLTPNMLPHCLAKCRSVVCEHVRRSPRQ